MTLKYNIYSMVLPCSESNGVINENNLLLYHKYTKFKTSENMLCGMLIFTLSISFNAGAYIKKHFQ